MKEQRLSEEAGGLSQVIVPLTLLPKKWYWTCLVSRASRRPGVGREVATWATPLAIGLKLPNNRASPPG